MSGSTRSDADAPPASGPAATGQGHLITTAEAAAIAVLDPGTYNAGLAPVRGVSAEALRARFRDPRPWQSEMLGDQQFEDGMLAGQRSYRRAAVLVPIVARESLSLLLTQRTSHLKNHAGQISFPGGRAEDDDADAEATALREAAEEIGLPPERVEVVGRLPDYYTVTDYEVTPVVALVHPPFELATDPNEVAEAFEVPLEFVLDPANHEKRSRPWLGRQRHFYAMPYRSYFIWGATAAMLRNFYHFMRA
ncbi:MAG: CoA pyrophosphatase [Burkholderiales bacterium]|nr:CoA pyrophosphatase [Burkholderiales bacterium]